MPLQFKDAFDLLVNAHLKEETSVESLKATIMTVIGVLAKDIDTEKEKDASFHLIHKAKERVMLMDYIVECKKREHTRNWNKKNP
jgi:hypothetical protein